MTLVCWLSTFKEWQATFVGVVAVAGTVLAWYNVSRQIRATSRATEILQRAYIAAIPNDVVPFHSDDDKIACNVVFKNVGHLPARKVAYAIRHTFSPDSQLSTFTSLEGSCEGNVVLPSGIEMEKGLHRRYQN
jgi:hypothetical protein